MTEKDSKAVEKDEKAEAVFGGLFFIVFLLWAFDMFFLFEGGCIEAQNAKSKKFDNAGNVIESYYCKRIGSSNVGVWTLQKWTAK